MSIIRVQNLSFGYDGSSEMIFENLSFQLDSSWKLGLVGRNGAGKTTLFRLLAGELEYSGEVFSPLEFEYFPYQVQGENRLTCDLLAELCSDAQEWQIRRELGLLRVEDASYYNYFDLLSSGERTKVLLAALFLREERFLLIDEPTNHLDMQARQAVSRYLAGKSGYIIISHDRAFLDGCTDHIMSINPAGIEISACNFSEYLRQKELRELHEQGENERLKRDIQRLGEAAERTTRWSDRVEKSKNVKVAGLRPDKGYIGHKAAKMAKRSTVAQKRIQRAVEEKSALLKNVEQAQPLKLHLLPYKGRELVRGSKLAVTLGGRELFSGLDFTIAPGERVAVTGPNGCGKSTLLQLVRGEALPHTGELWVGGGAVLSSVLQDTSHLQGSLEAYMAEQNLDETLFKAILRKLDFSRELFQQPLELYSSGQKKKVLLAHSLSTPASLYVWDEPLNFVDIYSRLQLENLLLEYQPTLLFVEHDQAFVQRIATKTITLQG